MKYTIEKPAQFRAARRVLLLAAVLFVFWGCTGPDDGGETIPGRSIGTAEDLAKIGVDSEYPPDGVYYLSADIDLADYTPWMPIGPDLGSSFTGTFDGRGKTIRGLTLGEGTAPAEVFGLFGYTSMAHIKNVRVELADTGSSPIVLTSSSPQYLGAIAGKAERTRFSGIIISGAGETVVNKAAGDVYAGGLTGDMLRSVAENIQCAAPFTVTAAGGNAGAGGIAGKNNSGSRVRFCYVSARVQVESGAGAYAGGIAGENSGAVQESYTTEDVSALSSGGSAYAGGIAGENPGALRDSYATGNISAQSDTSHPAYAGGMAGYNKKAAAYNNMGTIQNSYAAGTVSVTDSADAYAGGIAGYNDQGSIGYNAAWPADITATGAGQNAGRITGENTGGTLAGNIALDAITGTLKTDPSDAGTSGPFPAGSVGDKNGQPKTEANLQQEETFSNGVTKNALGWDFTATWQWDKTQKRPRLKWE
ncbi:MAG: hypothetical protein LBL28_03615 [Treponema sp.]|jgi:hypothetical protein|nr:hypothetical protein [Treponema sp.]